MPASGRALLAPTAHAAHPEEALDAHALPHAAPPETRADTPSAAKHRPRMHGRHAPVDAAQPGSPQPSPAPPAQHIAGPASRVQPLDASAPQPTLAGAPADPPTPAPVRRNDRTDISGSGQSGQAHVRVLPAETTVVRTAEDLQTALQADAPARDIDIRSHLDLRTLKLAQNPYLDRWKTGSGRSHVAYLSATTRSIRGNCGDGDAPADALLLETLTGATGAVLPLKPRQCMLLLDKNALSINDGRLWLDNLYFAVSQQPSSREALVLSAGVGAGGRPQPFSYFRQRAPLHVFATNVTVQGDFDRTGRVFAFAPHSRGASVLFQDSIFLNAAGSTAPFLIAAKSHGTFSNCFFQNIHMSGAELFDVSFGGSVTLRAVRMRDTTLAAEGVVDTSANDYVEIDPSRGNFDMYGDADMGGRDIPLLPAPDADRTLYGAEWVVHDATISDCIGGIETWEPGVMHERPPGCTAATEAAQMQFFTAGPPLGLPAAGMPAPVGAGNAAGDEDGAGEGEHAYFAYVEDYVIEEPAEGAASGSSGYDAGL
eukprot:jgi/Ulvmu1/5683/UM024_0030.1